MVVGRLPFHFATAGRPVGGGPPVVGLEMRAPLGEVLGRGIACVVGPPVVVLVGVCVIPPSVAPTVWLVTPPVVGPCVADPPVVGPCMAVPPVVGPCCTPPPPAGLRIGLGAAVAGGLETGWAGGLACCCPATALPATAQPHKHGKNRCCGAILNGPAEMFRGHRVLFSHSVSWFRAPISLSLCANPMYANFYSTSEAFPFERITFKYS